MSFGTLILPNQYVSRENRINILSFTYVFEDDLNNMLSNTNVFSSLFLIMLND